MHLANHYEIIRGYVWFFLRALVEPINERNEAARVKQRYQAPFFRIEAAGTIFSSIGMANHLIPIFMQYNFEVPEKIKAQAQEIVEIKLWGLYLLINRTALYNEMIQSSLDHGPVEKNPQNPGRITFRFNTREWESKIKKLLYTHRVPVIIKSLPISSFVH